MVAGGITEAIFALKAPSFGKGALTFLFGGLTLVVGIVSAGSSRHGPQGTDLCPGFLFPGGWNRWIWLSPFGLRPEARLGMDAI